MNRDLPKRAKYEAIRIEICGGIASGKTTLAKGKNAGIFVPILEQFTANPFWRAFYQDPKGFSFETEITFLLQHYHQIKNFAPSHRIPVCDFSLFLDRAYVDVTLSSNQRRVFESVYRQVRAELGTPRLLLYLRCGAIEQLRRVRMRRRKTERTIDLCFLDALNRAVDHHVDTASKLVNVVEINSEARDFAHDERTKSEVVAQIIHALDETASDRGKSPKV